MEKQFQCKKNFFIQRNITNEEHNNWLTNKVFTGKVAQFIIVNKEDNKDIGSVFLRNIDLKDNNAEYGIFIGDNNYRNKGIGTEAAKLICKYGFEILKLHRIFLRVYSSNKAAIQSYKKAGFVYEETQLEAIFSNGKYHNIDIMSIINNL